MSSSKRSNGFSFLLKCVIISCALLLCILILSFAASSGNDSSNKTSSMRLQSTAVPTATAEINNLVAWGTYYATKHMPQNMTLDKVAISTSIGEKYLTVTCNMDVMHDAEDYIRAAAKLICKVAPEMREYDGYDHMTFLFYAPFVDQYGNSNTSLGIRAIYTKEEIQKINYTYFLDRLYSDPEGVIKVNNDYLIHPAYTK